MAEVTCIQNTLRFPIIGWWVIQFAFVPQRAAGNMQNRLTNNRLNPPWLLSHSYLNFQQFWPAALDEWRAVCAHAHKRTLAWTSPHTYTHTHTQSITLLLDKMRTRRDFAGKIYNWRRKHKTPSHTSNKSLVCRVYKLKVQQSQGKALARPSHRALSQANQYHFPVLELGNYEVERLPDLSPALHYFADIKINCLILGKHMLQFKLSALVCSGIICIDLSASSQFCLLTSWIIREGALVS